MKRSKEKSEGVEKAATGVAGLDAVTGGGVPRGRPTLVCGGRGCGKSLLAIQFLVHGAVAEGEPGVLVTFEEMPDEIAANVASLGFDLGRLERERKLDIEYIHVDRNEIEEAGEYDLEGLFVRLGAAIDAIGAKRVAFDTIETLFTGLDHVSIMRAEVRRLFRWLKSRGVTAVITGERGEGSLTRHGLEEYVSDCVILLDHRVENHLSTRHLRVVKYRGSTHGTNEYPFLIDASGLTVLPITSLGLEHSVSSERISSGVKRLDQMLDGEGFFRGSTVLVSGTAGSGKSSLAAHLADATCRRGERCLWITHEESIDQIERNMRSIGIDLARCLESGLLRIHATRPSFHGLEMHLLTTQTLVEEHGPSVVIVDPVTGLLDMGTESEVSSMLTRLVDLLKTRGLTCMLTSLVAPDHAIERTEAGISSLIDTWIIVRTVATSGERNRVIEVLKSRGMAHSNQACEFLLTSRGLVVQDVSLGGDGLTGWRASRASSRRSRPSAPATRRSTGARRRSTGSAGRSSRRSPRSRRSSRRSTTTSSASASSTARGRRASPTTARSSRRCAAAASRSPRTRETGRSRRRGRRAMPGASKQGDRKRVATRAARADLKADVWQLRLYVAGQTARSITAFANLKRICEEHLRGRYTIEVIDLLKSPQLARGDQIFAVPALVRKLPPPMKKIIGDLSNTERVLVGLDIRPARPLARER